MPAQSQSEPETQSTHPAQPPQPDGTSPAISACETCPGTLVFLESGNTNGWIATDSVVELSR